MRRLAELYETLDQTMSTNAKVDALVDYFQSVPAADAAWTVFFLTGQRMKRFLNSRMLRVWVMQASELPDWLVEESYATVGDIAETVALLLENRPHSECSREPELPLNRWMHDRILPLKALDEDARGNAVLNWWRKLPTREIFLLNKLLTGGFRVGVSKTLVVRALARVANLEPATVHHRLMGEWKPTEHEYRRLLAADTTDVDHSRPYPYFLASPIDDDDPSKLGERDAWAAEWKWDGVRGQLIVRNASVFLWSRGEELVTHSYPEIADAAVHLPPGTVLDGEVLGFRAGAPLPFGDLQRRLGRKRVSKKTREQTPVSFVAYDLLERDGQDVRGESLSNRRRWLEQLAADWPKDSVLMISDLVQGASWEDLAVLRDQSRARGVEGLMLKRWSSPYRVGRRRGDWWKWKVEPFTIDAVLIYAQAGHGKRANLFTDYTFAIWNASDLVPVAKAYSGLSNEEIARLDKWIRKNTVEKFGPVRSVPPEHVFEIAFDGIRESKRHKSGIALRFPRIARWREDKRVEDADSLERVRGLL